MYFEKDYFIHYYDCTPEKRVSISSLLRYFEDIAILHSENVKLGIEYYSMHHVGWVLYKWDININRYPEFQETIRVRTKACYLKGFQAFRYFDVLDSKENQIVSANSMWLFLNQDTRRPAKITDDIFFGYNVDKNRMTQLEFGEIETFKKIDFKKEFDVRYMDIDTNRHVNNIKYVDWALEVIPVDILQSYFLNHLKVNYKKETSYGKNIFSAVDITREGELFKCIHQISSEENLLCILETNWMKCPPEQK